MRTCVFLIFLGLMISLILPTQRLMAQAHQGCAQVKNTSKFFSKELNQQVLLSAGRILPFRRTNQASQVEIYYKSYWIEAATEIFNYGPKNSCFIEPPCAQVNSVTGLYKDVQSKPRKITTAVEKEQFPITGVQKIKGKIFYQVDLGDDFAWILASKVEVKKESCGLASSSNRKWSIQVEIAQGDVAWQNQYSSVFKKDFASQDLNTTGDPVIVPQQAKIQKIEVRWFWPWKASHRLFLGADYNQRTWSLKQYADFRVLSSLSSLSSSPCSYPDPIISERTHQDSLAGLSFGYQWQALQKKKWSLYAMSSIHSRYVINNQFPYTHKIPCATLKNTVETTADWEFGGQLGLQWLYRWTTWATGLGLYVNEQLKPFVSLFFIFNKKVSGVKYKQRLI